MSKPAQSKGRSRHRSVRRFSGDETRRRSGDLAHELLHGAYLLERMFVAVLADSRPLREAHLELRVAIMKMEDALRDLYEAADAVLIEQLETHPHSVARLSTGWPRRPRRILSSAFPWMPNA